MRNLGLLPAAASRDGAAAAKTSPSVLGPWGHTRGQLQVWRGRLLAGAACSQLYGQARVHVCTDHVGRGDGTDEVGARRPVHVLPNLHPRRLHPEAPPPTPSPTPKISLRVPALLAQGSCCSAQGAVAAPRELLHRPFGSRLLPQHPPAAGGLLRPAGAGDPAASTAAALLMAPARSRGCRLAGGLGAG